MHFFFNDTATTEIYTLSLHDALPISSDNPSERESRALRAWATASGPGGSWWDISIAMRRSGTRGDRKSTRLNSSHANISYAVFCLKKKNYRHSTISYAVFCS